MNDGLRTWLIIALTQLPLVGGGWLWLTDRVRVRPLYAALVGELLVAANATTWPMARLAQRKYLARLLEYAYIGNKERDLESRPFWRRFGPLNRIPFLGKANDESAELQEVILDFYWWLQVVIAREEGRLPAWEGIRIVREQVSEDAAGGGKPRAPGV